MPGPAIQCTTLYISMLPATCMVFLLIIRQQKRFVVQNVCVICSLQRVIANTSKKSIYQRHRFLWNSFLFFITRMMWGEVAIIHIQITVRIVSRVMKYGKNICSFEILERFTVWSNESNQAIRQLYSNFTSYFI